MDNHPKLKVLFFGMAADVCGASEMQTEVVPTLFELKEILFLKFPGLASISLIWAVNHVSASGNTSLQPTDVVALMPPFSGG
jgi:molybdopterin converting factor small subunit